MAESTVLLGVTGGIAAYKAAWIASGLTAAGLPVDVVMTDAARKFVTPLTFSALTGRPVHTSLWDPATSIGHVSLAGRARLAVVAPATANTLAKLYRGLADNLLTSVLLAHEGPLLLAPAMNHGMWSKATVQQHVAGLAKRGAEIIGPDVGRLACGESGAGRMSDPGVIIQRVLARFANP